MSSHIFTSLLTLLAAVLVVHVSTELPDGYAVFKVQQKGACPTVYCPWYCDRYVDTNGCVYCGKCSKPHPFTCPRIVCPNLPLLECSARQGRDGCTVCKCRPRPRPMSAPLMIATPNVPPQLQHQEPPPPPPPPSKSEVEVLLKPTSRCPGPTPLCSRGCQLVKDERGCERCSCPSSIPKVTAAVITGGASAAPIHPVAYPPLPLKRKPPVATCPEAPDAPCPRPNVCWRERGADGCYGCRCRDDVAVCREVKCDFRRCQHVIDRVTGCATGCQCGNTTVQRNDV